MTHAASPQHPESESLTPTVDPRFFRTTLGGMGFIRALIELVKNSRDWGADTIELITTQHDELTVRDNGEGMNRQNRQAAISVNAPVERRRGQAGQFCTGLKHVFFSIASFTKIRTAPKDDPEAVWLMEFKTVDYERALSQRGGIKNPRLEKTPQTWPYEHATGTEFSFTLLDPKSRQVLRGDTLAVELSARLPMKFGQMLLVDGKLIPDKKIVGKIFSVRESHPHLGGSGGEIGEVIFELYRPVRRMKDEGLYFTASEVGEVPIGTFTMALGPLHELIPSVYHRPEVCGTISVPFLRDYAQEDRLTLSEAIADDPRTDHLLRVLAKYAPVIAARLKIETGEARTDASDEQVVTEVVETFNRRYHPSRTTAPPPGGSGEDQGDGEDDGDGEKKPVRLLYSHEHEPGEKIAIEVRLRPDLARAYPPESLEWYTKRSRCRNITKTPTGIEMIADEVGHGVVTLDLRGTPHSVAAHYNIVPARVFRLSVTHATIKVGGELPVIGINLDKLRGEVNWKLEGRGELVPQGGRAIYQATRPGRALITASDSKNPRTSATCDIEVEEAGRKQSVIRIREHEFAVEYGEHQPECSEDPRYQSPVILYPMPKINRLVINQLGRGYTVAREDGHLKEFLIFALAKEYPFFVHFQLEGGEGGDLPPGDERALVDQLCQECFLIYEEIMTGGEGGKET